MKKRDINLNLRLINNAIDLGWESLAFKANTVFGEYEGEKGSVLLETTGLVKIFDKKLDERFVNSEIFEHPDIVKAIKEHTIDEDDRYIIENNNWFVMTYVNADGKVEDDIVFELTPKKINEVVNSLRETYEYFTKTNKYLVVVLEKFCMDGQITENNYCLDLIDSDHIDREDYDKRDFFREFVLSTVEASSMQEAIYLASIKYEIEKEMLSAYKLA
jgi:hypothetical protein